MEHKRTSGCGLTRNQAALLVGVIGYGILVVVITPLLLGFLPLLAIGWILRVPVASDPADSAALEIGAAEPPIPVAAPTESVGTRGTSTISSRLSASD